MPAPTPGSASEQPVADVTVLGAGIVGVCSALALQERGFSVALIDRDEPGEAASHGNAGIVSPFSCVPQCMPGVWKSLPRWLLDPRGPVRVRFRDIPGLLPWAAAFFANTRPEKVHAISDAMALLMRGNIDAYRQLLKGTGCEGLLRDSALIHVFRGGTEPDLKHLGWRLRVDRRAPLELVGSAVLREIEPELSPDIDRAVVIWDQARALAPGTLCKALAAKAKRQGAIMVKREIKRLLPREDGAIDLESGIGTIRTDRLVLCCGVWSAELLRPLGFKLPLVSERGYHLEFIDPGVALNHSIFDVAGKFIVGSTADGIRSAGTSEFAAVDAPPNYRRADMLAAMSKRLIPRLDTRRARRWVGARPSFPDNLPVIGALPGHRNLYGAFGHSHYGLGMAPATGRIIANTVVGSTANANMSGFAVERFL